MPRVCAAETGSGSHPITPSPSSLEHFGSSSQIVDAPTRSLEMQNASAPSADSAVLVGSVPSAGEVVFMASDLQVCLASKL